MKKLILHIDDTNFETFRSFIETLDYVSISAEHDIPLWQKDEVNRRLELIDNGKMSSRSWKDAKKDLY